MGSDSRFRPAPTASYTPPGGARAEALHDMDTSVDRRGDVITVHVSGSVDGLTSEGLQRVLSAEVEAGHHHVVADFGAVDYTSSAGLRVLLATLKQTRSRGGDLRLAGPNPEVRKVLELSGFTGILRVFGTVDDAVASFG